MEATKKIRIVGSKKERKEKVEDGGKLKEKEGKERGN